MTRATVLFAAFLAATSCSAPVFLPPDFFQEAAGIPVVPDTTWISLAISPDPVEVSSSTSIVYGDLLLESELSADQTMPTASGTVEVILLMTTLPVIQAGALQNPQDTLWMWHTGLAGVPGVVPYAAGHPTDTNGQPDYTSNPTLPITADRFQSSALDAVLPGFAQAVLVAFYRNASGEITHSSSAVPVQVPYI